MPNDELGVFGRAGTFVDRKIIDKTANFYRTRVRRGLSPKQTKARLLSSLRANARTYYRLNGHSRAWSRTEAASLAKYVQLHSQGEQIDEDGQIIGKSG